MVVPAVAGVGTGESQQGSAQAPAAGASPEGVEKLPVMKTAAFKYNEIPVTTNGKNKSRRMFTAKTHTGFKMESHMSDIAPGEVNNPPHQHLRKEMMQIRLGVMVMTITSMPN